MGSHDVLQNMVFQCEMPELSVQLYVRCTAKAQKKPTVLKLTAYSKILDNTIFHQQVKLYMINQSMQSSWSKVLLYQIQEKALLWHYGEVVENQCYCSDCIDDRLFSSVRHGFCRCRRKKSYLHRHDGGRYGGVNYASNRATMRSLRFVVNYWPEVYKLLGSA